MAKQRQRKVPMRKCVVSEEMFPKRELVRIVRSKSGEVELDPTGRKNGRGAYIGLDPKIAQRAKELRSFDQVLNVSVPLEFYDEVIDYVTHQKARQEL